MLSVSLFLYSAGMGIANLVISLIIRLVTTYLGLLGNDLNLKERLFIAISWLPKATVQVGSKLDRLKYNLAISEFK